MLSKFRLSETAKAVLWLWQNDPGNWTIGTHAVVHRPTGVGVWTANEDYGLRVIFDVPERDRLRGHGSSGHDLRLEWRDRRALWRVVGRGVRTFMHQRVQRQISDWGADHIPSRTELARQDH